MAANTLWDFAPRLMARIIGFRLWCLSEQAIWRLWDGVQWFHYRDQEAKIASSHHCEDSEGNRIHWRHGKQQPRQCLESPFRMVAKSSTRSTLDDGPSACKCPWSAGLSQQAASKEFYPRTYNIQDPNAIREYFYCSFERKEVSPEVIDLTGDSDYSESSDE
jgi:hypothetical protein